MKKTINISIALLPVLITALALAFSSCQKDSDGSPYVEPGNPVLISVTPTSAQGDEMVTVIGTGLGDMQAVIFETDSVPTYLNPTLNTATSILFRVPADAFGGNQNIILINSKGKVLNVPFNVLAFPIVTAVSNYNFTAGSQIKLTGNNLNDVTSVKFTGTADAATIVSQTRKEMVIAMPSTTLTSGTLDITNVTGLTETTQVFVCIPNNFVMYADAWGPGAYNSGVQSWSYSCGVSETGDDFKTGTKGLKVTYQAGGGLSLFLGSDWGDPMHVFTDWYSPTYISFWAKAVGSAATLRIIPDSPPWDGTYSGAGSKTVDVPADVWTYFKFPSSVITGKYGRLNIICDLEKTVVFDDLLYID
jgi:hypothetical protein